MLSLNELLKHIFRSEAKKLDYIDPRQLAPTPFLHETTSLPRFADVGPQHRNLPSPVLTSSARG